MESPAELDNLLNWLGPGAETGAHRYVEVRRRLVTLFAFRGCADPEELADEALDRTAHAILKPGFVFQGNPMAYLRGVARNVYLESLRKNRTVSQELLPELGDPAAPASSSADETEALFACLDCCLGGLGDDKRSLLLDYYQGEKSAKIDGRLQLARKKGMAPNALRIQVFRLRNVVRDCVKQCAGSREIARSI